MQHRGDADPPATLRERVFELTGVNTARCYQCGKCSAGCPMAVETRVRPHDVMRLATLGQAERIFEDDSIWLCLTCESCSARCPHGCRPAEVIDAVREIAAHDAPESGPARVRAFHQAFLDQLRLNGRAFELGMVLEYKLRTGALMQDATAAPAMLSRGKLRLKPSRVRAISEVRRIFAKAGPR